MRSIKVALLLGATAALAGCNVTTNPVELSDGMHVRFPAEVPPESDREAKLAAVTNTALIYGGQARAWRNTAARPPRERLTTSAMNGSYCTRRSKQTCLQSCSISIACPTLYLLEPSFRRRRLLLLGGGGVACDNRQHGFGDARNKNSGGADTTVPDGWAEHGPS